MAEHDDKKRPNIDEPLILCSNCGSAEIQVTAWINANTGEIISGDGPNDLVWCPVCDAECSTIEDTGVGFELWTEGEWSGWFATFAEALAEAKRGHRAFEIMVASAPLEDE